MKVTQVPVNMRLTGLWGETTFTSMWLQRPLDGWQLGFHQTDLWYVRNTWKFLTIPIICHHGHDLATTFATTTFTSVCIISPIVCDVSDYSHVTLVTFGYIARVEQGVRECCLAWLYWTSTHRRLKQETRPGSCHYWKWLLQTLLLQGWDSC